MSKPGVQTRDLVPGDDRDAAAFRALNEEWLTRYFVVEPGDHTMLADPVGQIIAPGGAILLAEADGQIIGCCALLAPPADDPQTYKVAKLAVTASSQGQQIGRRLMEAVIARARALRATRLVLITNSGLQPARRLYESLHFTYMDPARVSMPGEFKRGDTFMELPLAINHYCPHSGKPVGADSLTTYRGFTVGFCNPGCRDDFARNPEKFPRDIGYFDALIKEHDLTN